MKSGMSGWGSAPASGIVVLSLGDMSVEGKKVNIKFIFVTMLLSSIISGFVAASMGTAIPAIMEEFAVSAGMAQWLTSLYSLAAGILTIATAFIIKRFPTKRVFFMGIGLFTVGVLACVFSSNFMLLIVGRILQGVGSGILISMTQVVILTLFPQEKRGFMMGFYGLAVGFTPVFGPVIAGILIDHGGWRMLFVIALVMCIADIVMGLICMRNVLETVVAGFDIGSMALAGIGFTGITLALGNMGAHPFLSPQVGLALLIGIAGLAVFVLRQLKLDDPLLEMRTFKTRDFAVAVFLCMAVNALMNGTAAVMTIFVQTIQGGTATQFGLILMPFALIVGLLSPVVGKWYDKAGMRPIALFGGTTILVSAIGLLFLNESTPGWFIMILFIVMGLGVPGFMTQSITWGMDRLSDAWTADGTAIINCLRTIGNALGTAVFVALMSGTSSSGAELTAADARVSFIGMFGLAVALFIVSVFLVRKPKKAVG